MKKKIFMVFVCVLLCMCFAGCKGKKDTQEPTMEPDATGEVSMPTEEPVVTPEPTADPNEGKVKSLLTGQYVSEKKAKKRPYAVMIKNIEYAARHQSGISKAQILYEAKVEG